MLSTDQVVSINSVNNAIASLKQLKPCSHPYLLRYAYEWIEILERVKNEIAKQGVDLDKFSDLEKTHG
jgi:hypothetical protein